MKNVEWQVLDIEGRIAGSGSTAMSERGEGDLDGGKDGDGAGDEPHVGVENENVIDGGTSYIAAAEHDALNDEQPTTFPTPRTMSVLTLQTADVALHSPSNIIGTPFATDSAPYEYPFPDNSKTTDGRDTLQPTPSVISSVSSSFSSLSSRSSFPMSSSSLSQLPSLSTTPSSVSSFTHHPAPDLCQRYSPTHPKLRPGNPPVPPALVKKRQRWSLNLLQRRSSSGSSTSAGPEAASDDTASEGVTYSLRLTRTNEEVVVSTSQRQQSTEEGGTQVQRSLADQVFHG